jgi:PPOX class probable F420-dependent enzyme
MSSAATATPPQDHLDLLERPTFAHFATVRSDGAPQVNPMWFLWDGEEGVIKLTHTNVRHNYRYIQREPRVAFSIADPDNGYRYLQIRGTVEKVEEDPGGEFYQTLQRRYLGRASTPPDADVRVVLTVRPTGFRTMGG